MIPVSFGVCLCRDFIKIAKRVLGEKGKGGYGSMQETVIVSGDREERKSRELVC